MTSFKQEFSTEPSPSSFANCNDQVDFDSYINLDQTIVPTPSRSPSSFQSKSTTTPSLSKPSTTPIASTQPAPQTFAGPSYQYEQYKQQTGLPVGALANTFAINQVDQFAYARSQQSFEMLLPSDGYFGINMTDDLLDFGTSADQETSADMDFDFSPTQDLPVSDPNFVNPAIIGGQESTQHTQPAPSQPIRVWPGIHQQQAALAKAQLQESQQQQKQNPPAEQQRKEAPGHSRNSSRSGSSARPPTDPIVEESISRLLNQMRHSSVSSSNDDEGATPNANGSSQHGARSKKDEEDMDEDERLLASEEGKRLSSKERRQLRNKVSARAFRSRRKEYIGQLEGEIAAKASEADDLRNENHALKEENKKLTDLTRMLLSSPAFSNFLGELSVAEVPSTVPAQSQTPASRPQSSSRKDVNPNQFTSRQNHVPQQNNFQVGMAMIPEESEYPARFEYNGTASAITDYTNNTESGPYDAQVYAVTTFPQGPAIDSIDFTVLDSKSSNKLGSSPAIGEPKNELVSIEPIPMALEKAELPEPVTSHFEDADNEFSDPAFALFIDRPTTSSPAAVAPGDRIFGEIELEKAFGRFELIIEDEENESERGDISSTTIERFERLCLRLDAASARVAAVTAHL